MNSIPAIVASIALASASFMPNAASADGNDLAKAIAGIVAVGIIAKAIDNRNDRGRASTTTRAGRLGSIEQTFDGRRVIDRRVRDYEQRKGPKAKRGYKKKALPQACLRVVETDRRDRLAYGSRCLNRNYRHASKLPVSCETVVRTNRGFRTVFGARCLRRDGWKVATR